MTLKELASYLSKDVEVLRNMINSKNDIIYNDDEEVNDKYTKELCKFFKMPLPPKPEKVKPSPISRVSPINKLYIKTIERLTAAELLSKYGVDRRKVTGIDEVDGMVYLFSSIPFVDGSEISDEGYISNNEFKYYGKPDNSDGTTNAFTQKLIDAKEIRLYVYFSANEYYYQGNVKIVSYNNLTINKKNVKEFILRLI